MTLTATKASGQTKATDALLLLLFKGEGVPKDYRTLDAAAGALLPRTLALKDFSGECCTCQMVYTNGGVLAKRLLLVGLGTRKDFDSSEAIKSLATVIGRHRKAGLRSVAVPFRSLPRMDARAFGNAVPPTGRAHV